MPQYQFQCQFCYQDYTITSPENPPPCPSCGAKAKRVYSFTTGRGMPEHFNNAVGQFVSNKSQFYDALKIKSEEDSIRRGMTVDYQPVDPSDMKDAAAHGVTDEGLESTARATFTKD